MIRKFIGKHIVKPTYKSHDLVFGGSHEYCEICGMPIRDVSHAGVDKTVWAKGYPLMLERTGNVLFAVCSHCRKRESWITIKRAYYSLWESIENSNLFLLVPFTRSDFEEAVSSDKANFQTKFDVKFWKTTLKRAYTESIGMEYCSMPSDRVVPELISACKYLIDVENLDIKIIEENNRVSLILKAKLWEERKNISSHQTVIALPSNL